MSERKQIAGHEVTKVKSDEWRKLGYSLQGDFVHSQEVVLSKHTIYSEWRPYWEESVTKVDRYCVKKRSGVEWTNLPHCKRSLGTMMLRYQNAEGGKVKWTRL